MTRNLSEEIVRSARRQHRCDWCGESIQVGTSYVRQFNVDDDGSAGTYRAHPECDSAQSTLDIMEQECLPCGAVFTRGCTCESGDSFCDRTPRCAGSKDGAP